MHNSKERKTLAGVTCAAKVACIQALYPPARRVCIIYNINIINIRSAITKPYTLDTRTQCNITD
jgi:hypothetical protein